MYMNHEVKITHRSKLHQNQSIFQNIPCGTFKSFHVCFWHSSKGIEHLSYYWVKIFKVLEIEEFYYCLLDYANPTALNPNWELLTPIGYKFFLQGNTGLALNETTNLDREHFDLESCKFECKAEECPVLLKQSELRGQFANKNIGSVN